MNEREPKQRASSWRWIGIPIAVIAVALLWVLWPQRAAHKAQPPATNAPAKRAAVTNVAHSRPVFVPAPRVEPKPAQPVIDAVTVEKKSVCEGEENLITVTAHLEGSASTSLRYRIAGAEGGSVPLRDFLEPDGTHSQKYVRVFGPGDTEVTAAIPHYEVRRCRPLRWLDIELRQRPNSDASYEFKAKLKSAAGAPSFELASYEWSFGDGEKAVTTSPFADHSYDEREQKSAYSGFLVQVTAISKTGERVLGRHSIELLNGAFDDLERVGYVTLMNEPTPRVPALGADGRVTQRFRIHHVHEQPVLLDEVIVRGHRSEGSGDERAEELDPSVVLGLDEVPPGQGIEVTLSFDAASETKLFMKSFELSGHTPDGLPAGGTLTIMRPQQPPTRENHVPVTDPELIPKIVAAQKLLGKEIVSQEDIYLLERDGRLTAEIERQTADGEQELAAIQNLPKHKGLPVLETMPGPPQ